MGGVRAAVQPASGARAVPPAPQPHGRPSNSATSSNASNEFHPMAVVKCPVCSQQFFAMDLERHTNACLDALYYTQAVDESLEQQQQEERKRLERERVERRERERERELQQREAEHAAKQQREAEQQQQQQQQTRASQP